MFERLGGKLGEIRRDQMLTAAHDRRCDERVSGRPRSHVTAHDDEPIQVRVGKQSGRFLVQSHSGTTLVSREFAQRAGIQPSAAAAETFAAGRIRTGRVATAPWLAVHGATVEGIDIIVVDEFDSDVDGVLGLNFSWWFAPNHK
jgi:hypothetical protein